MPDPEMTRKVEDSIHLYRWSYDGDDGSLPMLVCSREVAYDYMKARRAFFRRDRVTCPRCLSEHQTRITHYNLATDPEVERQIEEHTQ
jgi:hypothetical protein